MSDLDITDSVLAELRSAADIVEVIGDHTKLKKAGRSWKGLCPFHKERTPSFTVDRDKGLYHCFGCGAGGDVIHFVRQIDRLEFPEAVEALAARFGVAIPRRTARGPRDDRREKLLAALSAAHRFFVAELAKPGNRAAKYLEGRKVSSDMAHRLGLGYAPDSWEALSRSLSPAFPESLLLEAGLLQTRSEGKGSYDRFRDRLIFVVTDERGRPVGFGGRALTPEAEPKYLNSPESPVFSKKRLLYGLAEGREAIRRRERVVLVEGYFDHLAVLAAGHEEVVASMGTALTEEQASKLKRLASRVTVCYDGDQAGRAATRGALKHLLAQGFDANVVRLPSGEDPYDVLSRAGPKKLSELIDEAEDYLTWLLQEVQPSAPGLNSSERSARLVGILETVREIPDSITRQEEAKRLSKSLAIHFDVLWERLKRGPSDAAPPLGTTSNRSVFNEMEITGAEKALLRLLLESEFNSLILSKLDDRWVKNETVRKLIAELRLGLEVGHKFDFSKQTGQFSDTELNLLARINARDEPQSSEERVLQVLSSLEQGHLEERGELLKSRIARDEIDERPSGEIDALILEKEKISKRVLELKKVRKGNELGD